MAQAGRWSINKESWELFVLPGTVQNFTTRSIFSSAELFFFLILKTVAASKYSQTFFTSTSTVEQQLLFIMSHSVTTVNCLPVTFANNDPFAIIARTLIICRHQRISFAIRRFCKALLIARHSVLRVCVYILRDWERRKFTLFVRAAISSLFQSKKSRA